jgi:hypothetical protein
MITVNIGNEKVEIPEYLTVDMFQQIQKNPIRYNNSVDLLSLYLNKTPDEIRDYPKDNIDFVEGFISSQVLQTPEDIKLESIIEYDGVRYGLENQWNNLKWGMWVDMEVFSQEDKINEHIHFLMAILYRPIVSETKKGYTIEPYKSDTVKDRAEIMKKMDVKHWLGVAAFFLETSNQYIKGIKRSLRWKMMMWRTLNWINNQMMKLPSFLHLKVLRDFISNSPLPLLEKTLQSFNK